jgi:NADPH:quinone reductase-like Zn-dependent oxidoreductase
VRAIVVHEGGGPDVLELEEVPDPAASNGQVLVRVEAAAVNHCRHLGADVYATASSSKHDRLRELGAEPLAYDDERLPELHAEAVLDPVLGEGLEKSLAALAPGGRGACSRRSPGHVGRARQSDGLGQHVDGRRQPAPHHRNECHLGYARSSIN